MAVNKLLSDVVVTEGSDYITYNDVKTLGRITSTSEQSLITSLIKASRQMIENYLGVDLVTKTRKAIYSEVTTSITLAHAPVISVQSMYTLTGPLLNTKTLNASCDYYLHGNVIRNTMPYGKEINYTTGYTNSTCPELLKQAVIKQALMMFDKREVDSDLDDSVKKMINTFKRNFI